MLFRNPVSWDAFTPDERAEFTGGCGPGGIGDKLVPDTVWGLSIFEACQRHDFAYHFGTTGEDKARADYDFLRNMFAIIDARSKFKVVAFARRRRALKYFEAVWYGGHGAFAKKEKPTLSNHV
jgi:hypothetical protein